MVNITPENLAEHVRHGRIPQWVMTSFRDATGINVAEKAELDLQRIVTTRSKIWSFLKKYYLTFAVVFIGLILFRRYTDINFGQFQPWATLLLVAAFGAPMITCAILLSNTCDYDRDVARFCEILREASYHLRVDFTGKLPNLADLRVNAAQIVNSSEASQALHETFRLLGLL